MRRRLVAYFDRKNRRSPDELADETFNRIGWILTKDGSIATTPPARYCYAVAKFVFLEDVRRDRTHVSFDQSLAADGWAWRVTPAEPDEGLAIREQRFDCLDRCLQALKPEQRELIVEYYRDTGQQKIRRRREMARRMGITMNALGIRACRIRRALEERVTSVLQRAAVDSMTQSSFNLQARRGLVALRPSTSRAARRASSSDNTA